MSTFLRVFCRSSALVTPAELAQFILDGIFFEQPRFDPPDALERTAGEDWESLAIFYDREMRPIVLWRTSAGPLLAEDIAEATDALSSADTLYATDLADRLAGTSVIYAFEVNESTLTDDAWNMLDALEAHLARQYDGIVYAAGDGFFDADLIRVATLS